MPIKLNGSTSGYVQIDAPAVAGTTQITLPAVTGGSFIVSDASGNVGIGTTSPTQKLQVNGAIQSGATGTNGSLFLARTSDGLAVGKVTITESTQVMDYNNLLGSGLHTFTINSVERMRIDSSGVVQVGGTTVANTTGYVNSRTNTRAWVRWVGSSGTVTASYNVSSVTRNSTGNYTVNFTTSLADANYAPIGMTAGAGTYNSFGVYMQQTSAPTAASCAVTTLSNSGTAVDCIANQLVIFGN